MQPQPDHRLADDHAELDELLKQLRQALDEGDREASHAKLDLFWARLAVHIRAEHVQLFPTILKRIAEHKGTDMAALDEAQSIIAGLRGDHDFFMHELAHAIAILRELKNADSGTVKLRMPTVREIVLSIAERLLVHNRVEEERVYLWAIMFLSEQERLELSTRIEEELAKPPARFSSSAWARP